MIHKPENDVITKVNHWFDGVAGCAVVAAVQGCILFGTDGHCETPTQRVRLSKLQRIKR